MWLFHRHLVKVVEFDPIRDRVTKVIQSLAEIGSSEKFVLRMV